MVLVVLTIQPILFGSKSLKHSPETSASSLSSSTELRCLLAGPCQKTSRVAPFAMPSGLTLAPIFTITSTGCAVVSNLRLLALRQLRAAHVNQLHQRRHLLVSTLLRPSRS